MTTPTPLIGITGKAGSGKTLAASWFLKNHTNVIKLAFASPLKVMLYELIRHAVPKTWPTRPADYIDDPILKETPIPFLGNHTARHLMQTLGTEWGRNSVHPDFWVAIAAGKYERLLASGFKGGEIQLKAIFDDLRFANEAAMVRAYDGKILRIVRPDADKPADIDAHASERMDFDADHVIINDGTPEDLHAKLAALWPPTVKPKA
jgi:hypothetical protein